MGLEHFWNPIDRNIVDSVPSFWSDKKSNLSALERTLAIRRLLPMNALSGTMSFLNDFCLLVVKAGRSYVCDALNLTCRCRNVCTNMHELHWKNHTIDDHFGKNIWINLSTSHLQFTPSPPHSIAPHIITTASPLHIISPSHHVHSTQKDMLKYVKVTKIKNKKCQEQEAPREKATRRKRCQPQPTQQVLHPNPQAM